jgi:uncharacterized membrane protein
VIMSNDADLTKSEVKHIEVLASSEASGFHNAAVHFSTLIVANLMLLNSGALFAFPNFIEKLSGSQDKLLLAISVSHVSTYFILGLVGAILCAYVAYLNYGILAQLTYQQSYLDQLSLRYPEDRDYEQRVFGWFLRTRNSLIKSIKKRTRWVNITFWLGQLFGIGSGVMFLLGCYFARGSILDLVGS